MTTSTEVPERVLQGALSVPRSLSPVPLLTVKQVAPRLGVSKSTIYRMDREHGPFPFVKDRRYIFIEADGFQLYLDTRRREEVGADLDLVDVIELKDCVTPVKTIPAELGEENQSAASAIPARPPSTSEGQRDLLSAFWRPPQWL